MVALIDFSGLVSSAWALASAVAIAPMFSLDRCMGPLPVHHFKTHGPGLRALGPNPVPKRLLDVLGNKFLELSLGFLVVEKGLPGAAEDSRELSPGVRGAHVHNA